jgi:hypothetical protein
MGSATAGFTVAIGTENPFTDDDFLGAGHLPVNKAVRDELIALRTVEA